MKLKYLLSAIFFSLGITAFTPIPAYTEVKSSVRTTNNLYQIAQEITVLVNQNQKYGSGFIVGRGDFSYYVLTASHVVNSDGEIQITAPDKRRYNASIITRSLPNLDLAILEFKSENTYQVSRIADYRFSEATPFGSGGNIYISGWERRQGSNQVVFSCGTTLNTLDLFLRQDPISEGYELVYTNITQSGLSGGPILDNQGHVIGIHGRAEGEELEAIGSLKLGLSLGIPSFRFLQVLKDNSISLPLLIENEPPKNLYTRSSSGHDPCEADLPSPKISDSAIDWANYANSMLRVGRFVDALSAYDKAIEKNINGELYQIWYGRGLTLILLNRPNEALENFDRALKLWSKLPNEGNHNLRLNVAKTLILRFKGILLTASGNSQEALYAYNEALKISPNNQQVWLLKASVLNNLDRYSETLAAYNEAIRIEPHPSLFVARSNIYFQAGQYDSAMEDLDYAIKLNPYNSQMYAIRGAMKRKLGDTRGANIDHQKVYELASQFSQFSETGISFNEILIGQAEFFAGNTEAGIQSLTRGIERLGNRDTGIMMADLFERMLMQMNKEVDRSSYADIFIDVVKDFSQDHSDVEIDGFDESTVHVMRAIFLMRVHIDFADLVQVSDADIAKASNEVEKAIRLDRGNEQMHFAYAMRSAFRENNGNKKEANEDFEKALEVAPQTFEVYVARGMTRLNLGNTEESLADLEIAAEMLYKQDDMENYQKVMSIIDRIQGSPR